MAKALHEQLRTAFDSVGWSMGELRQRAGLDIDESSLGRKLNGKQLMRTAEAEALARALGVRLTYGRGRQVA